MNQVEINVIQTQAVKASLKCSVYVTQTLGGIPDLCGDEKFFSGNAASGDSSAYAFFVFVNGSSINQAIAVLHGADHGIFCFVIFGGFIYTQS